MPADERAVPGLEVEGPGQIDVELVLVVHLALVGPEQPRVVHEAGPQLVVLGHLADAVDGPQPAVHRRALSAACDSGSPTARRRNGGAVAGCAVERSTIAPSAFLTACAASVTSPAFEADAPSIVLNAGAPSTT